MPERPKKIAPSPFGPTLAEQCIGSTSRVGSTKFEIAEHRFLDLAGIAGAADQDEPGGEVDEDEGLGADAVELGDRAEIAARAGS